MNKKDVAKILRKKLTEAIRSLPNVEYQRVSLFQDETTEAEHDHERLFGGMHDYQCGDVHIIELTIETRRNCEN